MTRAELIEKLRESRTWTPDNWVQMSLESAHLMMDAAQMLSRSDYSSNSAIQQLEQEAVNLPKFLKDLLLRAVDELRVSHAAWREAEGEIVSLERTVMRVESQYTVQFNENEKLRAQIDQLKKERDEALKKIDELQDVCGDSADWMVKLRKERDEARREVCFLLSRNVTQGCDGDTPEFHATARGWCYLLEEDDE
jgi:uncharacterized coiled-coil DUF342 family protein